MITLYPATDSMTRITLPRILGRSLRPNFPPSTIGGRFWTSYIAIADVDYIVEPVLKTLHETEDPKVKEDARKLILGILSVIHSLTKLGSEFGHMPSLQAANMDDGSVLIEWIFENFRVGFTIEKNSEESGWYLVSGKNLGQINAYGNLNKADDEKLLSWLLVFVISNY